MSADSDFDAQFVEIMNDLRTDLGTTLDRFPPTVRTRLFDFAKLMTRSEDQQTINDVMTGFILLFMIGREHRHRGYPSPVPKEGEGDMQIDADLRRLQQEEGE